MLSESFNRSAVGLLVILKVYRQYAQLYGRTERLYWSDVYGRTWSALRYIVVPHPVTICMKERSSYATTICRWKV